MAHSEGEGDQSDLNGSGVHQRRRPERPTTRTSATNNAADLPPKIADSDKKSWVVAYVLWFFFGWCGAHLFYLGRDFHAFVSITTFGRFGVGLLLDIFRIPSYVAQANEDSDAIADWDHHTRKSRSKCLSCCSFPRLSRTLLHWCTMALFIYLAQAAVPTDISNYHAVMGVVAIVAVSVAVWLVGNIGIEKIGFVTVFVSAVLSYIVIWALGGHEASMWLICPMIVVACNFTEYKSRSMRSSVRQIKARGKWTRRGQVLSGFILFGIVWTGIIIMNLEIQNERGEPVKLYDAMKNFYNSPAWEGLFATFDKVREETFRERSDRDDNDDDFDSKWDRFFSSLKDAFDVDGERRALRDLGLPEDATDSQIKNRYRKLAKENHPDRNRGNEKEASNRFMKIQEAYETLQKYRTLRKGGQQRQKD